MQQTTIEFEDEKPRAPPLEADQEQRLIELMAQAIEAVLQHDQIGQGEEHDRS